jgi:hypothetical protein
MKDAGQAGQLGFHHGITEHKFEKPNEVLDHIFTSREGNKVLNEADRAPPSCKPGNSPPNATHAMCISSVGFGVEKHDDVVDALVYLILGLVDDGIEEQKVHYV